MSTLPIDEYALLSDCHTAALVSRHGSVDWLCFPRFDAPALFARLLDSGAGHWIIRPASDDFTAGPCASATAPGTSGSSTSTASCWTPPGGSVTIWRTSIP